MIIHPVKIQRLADFAGDPLGVVGEGAGIGVAGYVVGG